MLDGSIPANAVHKEVPIVAITCPGNGFVHHYVGDTLFAILQAYDHTKLHFLFVGSNVNRASPPTIDLGNKEIITFGVAYKPTN